MGTQAADFWAVVTEAADEVDRDGHGNVSATVDRAKRPEDG